MLLFSHVCLDHWEAQAVFAMTARFWATYAMQVMPTQLRGQGTALVNVMSMVSQMASPYIVYSVGENYFSLYI